MVSQASQGAQPRNASGRPGSQGLRQAVAVILMWRGRIGLFKRSESVQHDAGLWHCITGYLDADSDPVRQAIQEIWEETLLPARALEQLTAGPTLRLADPRGGPDWTVHTFWPAPVNAGSLSTGSTRHTGGYGPGSCRSSTGRSHG
ncbi:NUDIX domain-containing protein [Streptomyces hygroscopicus]|uniref:NUDIX domain-containing protein n=1 Tax=Streptomyces hygroscopicus TaxID=1912 RepID=UPI003558A6DD